MTKTLWIYFSGSRIFCLNAPKTRLKHFVFTATMIEKSLSPSENLTSALGLPKSIDSSWALEVGNFNQHIGTRPWAWERECRFWNLVFLIHFWLVLIWQNKKFFGHHVENSPVAPPHEKLFRRAWTLNGQWSVDNCSVHAIYIYCDVLEPWASEEFFSMEAKSDFPRCWPKAFFQGQQWWYFILQNSKLRVKHCATKQLTGKYAISKSRGVRPHPATLFRRPWLEHRVIVDTFTPVLSFAPVEGNYGDTAYENIHFSWFKR